MSIGYISSVSLHMCEFIFSDTLFFAAQLKTRFSLVLQIRLKFHFIVVFSTVLFEFELTMAAQQGKFDG